VRVAAYLIAEIEVIDPVGYEEYRSLVPASLEKYGGQFVVRGGAHEVLEGDWRPHRLVVIRFDNIARAKEWHGSPEYRPALAIRQRTARTRSIVVEGV
jgi:uncharacterized protein (DUF1330 family)